MVSINSVKTSNRSISATTLAKIKKVIGECSVFRLVGAGEDDIRVFYGGCYAPIGTNLANIYSDMIRTNVFAVVDLSDIETFMMYSDGIDIYFRSGYWLSGQKIEKIGYDYVDVDKLLFNDDKIITHTKVGDDDVYVAKLHKLSKKISGTLEWFNLNSYERSYSNPLTFAYIRNNGVIKIGLWDMINNRFVGRVLRYPWSNLLTTV